MTFKSLFTLKANAVAFAAYKVGEQLGNAIGNDKIVEVVDSIYGIYDTIDTVVTAINLVRCGYKAYKMGKVAWQLYRLYKAADNEDAAANV